MDVMIPLLEGDTQTYDITYYVKTVTGDYQAIRAVGAVLRDADGKSSLIGEALFNESLTEHVSLINILTNKIAYLGDLTRAIREEMETF